MNIKKVFVNNIPLFSGMYNGILAIILGLILLFDPDKSEPKLTYLMGCLARQWIRSSATRSHRENSGSAA
jgi:uncharacterized membrane protein HdeD (DUF308 family)